MQHKRDINIINEYNRLKELRYERLNKILGNNLSVQPFDSFISLTDNDKNILCLLSMNKSTKEIADDLSKLKGYRISASTICSVICKKLYRIFKVYSTSALIEKATRLNLVPFELIPHVIKIKLIQNPILVTQENQPDSYVAIAKDRHSRFYFVKFDEKYNHINTVENLTGNYVKAKILKNQFYKNMN